MLRSGHPKKLKFCIGDTRGVDEQFATEGEGIEIIFDAQGFELEGRANRHKNVVALGS